MTREESKMMQGLGILVMIFYHLFEPHMNPEFANTVIGNMGRAANPVPLYCLLSGYGLYIVHSQGKDKHRWTRCAKLYTNYWMITAMFVCISLLMGQTRCILSPSVIVSNMVDWHTDYYLPAWFILPYCILSVCSQWIFRVTDKLNVWLVLIIGYGIYVFSSRMNVYDWFRMNIFQTLYIFFPFLLGGVMARTRLVERCDAWLSKMPLALVDVFLGCVLVVRYFLYTGAVISFFWAAVIVIAVHHVRRVGGGIVLKFFGKHNLNMWMIHAWICSYLFRPQIAALGNPLLMFLVEVGVCVVLSMVFNLFLQPLNRLVFHGKTR